MKALLVIIVVGIIAAIIFPFLRFTPLQPSIEQSPTPTQVVKKAPSCQAITVKGPIPGEKITPPTLTVTVVVNNTDLHCRWTVYEAQAGTLELQDDNQNTIGTGTLSTTDDWMADKPVTYTGTIPVNTVGSGEANLIITEENPSGQDNPKTISIPLTF